MPNAQKVNYLRGKDLITVGIFSAIYFVLNLICMLISGLHPLVWILMPMNIAVVTGVPFLRIRTEPKISGGRADRYRRFPRRRVYASDL